MGPLGSPPRAPSLPTAAVLGAVALALAIAALVAAVAVRDQVQHLHARVDVLATRLERTESAATRRDLDELRAELARAHQSTLDALRAELRAARSGDALP